MHTRMHKHTHTHTVFQRSHHISREFDLPLHTTVRKHQRHYHMALFQDGVQSTLLRLSRQERERERDGTALQTHTHSQAQAVRSIKEINASMNRRKRAHKKVCVHVCGVYVCVVHVMRNICLTTTMS